VQPASTADEIDMVINRGHFLAAIVRMFDEVAATEKPATIPRPKKS
jgi:deoxyribose-phosphate aldolase